MQLTTYALRKLTGIFCGLLRWKGNHNKDQHRLTLEKKMKNEHRRLIIEKKMKNEHRLTLEKKMKNQHGRLG